MVKNGQSSITNYRNYYSKTTYSTYKEYVVILQQAGQSIKNHGSSGMVLSKKSYLIRLINHSQYLNKPKTI